MFENDILTLLSQSKQYHRVGLTIKTCDVAVVMLLLHPGNILYCETVKCARYALLMTIQP